MRLRPLFSLGLCFASGTIFVAAYSQSFAQAAKKPARKVPAAPSASQEGAVIVSGDRSVSDANTETSKLTGNVTVTQTGEDFILYAQNLRYSKPQNRAIATDNLRVVTRDSTIRGLKIDADFNTKVLTMTGNVTISTHGKGDGITGNRQTGGQTGGLRAEFTSKASKLYCDRVDWDYETREAVLTGNIRMVQGKNSGTCERIEFDERQNVIRLLGKVRFIDDKGQVYSTPDLTIYNDENSIETGPSTLQIKPNAAPGAAPRPAKPPVAPKRAPKISNEDLSGFDAKPSPIPALRPEPTRVPPPVETPETPDETAPASSTTTP